MPASARTELDLATQVVTMHEFDTVTIRFPNGPVMHVHVMGLDEPGELDVEVTFENHLIRPFELTRYVRDYQDDEEGLKTVFSDKGTIPTRDADVLIPGVGFRLTPGPIQDI